MKKLLLLMVAAVSTLAAWAYTETPIITYDYSDKYEPGYQETALDGQGAAWSSLTTQPSFDNNGVLIFAGGPTTTPLSSNFGNMKPGIFICDLGGAINRVLVVNGSGSKFSDKADALSFASKKSSTYNPYYCLSFYNNSSSYSTSYAKVRVVFSVCTSVTETGSALTISVENNGGVSPNGSGVTTTTDLTNFGGANWDGTKWGVYECICPGLTNHARVKIATPGGKGQSIALIVKSVEFIALDGATDSDINTGSITIEDRVVDINADHTKVALTGTLNLKNDIDVSNRKFVVKDASSERYPTYYEKINALELPFTIIPDINKVADGKSLTASLNVLGNGATLSNAHNNLNVTVPATSGAPIDCNLENIIFRGNYTLQLNSVQYSDEESATTFTDNSSSQTAVKGISRPGASFTANVDEPVLFKIGTLNCVILQDSFTATNTSNFAGYVSYTMEQDGNSNLDAGILTENYTVGENTYGVTGYASREETEDFVFAKHNWSSIMFNNGKGKIVYHVANILPDKAVTRKPTIYYPLYVKPEVSTNADYSVDASAITDGDINVANFKAEPSAELSATFSYTATTDAINALQTSVANVAVDASGKVEFYNLQGVKVAEDALTPGIYVRRAAGKAVKVIVK